MNVALKNGSVILFALTGLVLGCSSGSTDSATAPPATPPKTAAASIATDGASLFAQKCAGCHGDKGAGGRRAPVLAGKHVAEAEAANIIVKGKGKMPPVGAALPKDQVDAIAKYVSTL